MLEEHPRPDRPGFQPCEADGTNIERRREHLEAEQRVRETIRDGRKLLDE